MKQLNPKTLSAKHFFAQSLIATTAFLLLNSAALAFTDIKGKKVELEKQLGGGKWSIVEIWASDCHACRLHMPSMVKFDGKLENARIIGVTLDGQEGIEDSKSFIKKFDMKFKNIISNPIEVNAWMQKNVGESLIGTPTFMIFDPEGKLAAAQPGPVATDSLETFIKENSVKEEQKI
ncbi:MAG TPA: TlpA family protein disulfide reductase [Leucothrix mucor]|nr:TlpA family protein disulfide reductase [Leucothrix mucor]